MNTPGGEVVGLDSHRRTADRRQAEYYRQLLEGHWAQVMRELSQHAAALAEYKHLGDLSGVRRTRQLVRAKETELNTLSYLLRGLQARFGGRGTGPRR